MIVRIVGLTHLVLMIPTLALAGEVTLCKSVSADLKPVEATTQFPAGVKEVYAVLKLDAGEQFKTINSTWIAVDVGDAAPANFRIASADLDLKDQKTAKLSYTQPGPMPDGKYRVEILADGKPWKAVDFTVGTASATTTQPATSPAER